MILGIKLKKIVSAKILSILFGALTGVLFQLVLDSFLNIFFLIFKNKYCSWASGFYMLKFSIKIFCIKF